MPTSESGYSVIMSIGLWQIIILLIIFLYFFLPIILCLVLIKKKNYKKLSKKQEYAGFWFRLIAGFFDIIILTIVAIILGRVLGSFFVFIEFFIGWFYFVVLQSSAKRATLGMRAVGIKIHDEQLGRLGFWRLTGRYFATWLSTIILFIGFFMIGVHPRKQGLHDLIARTIHTREY